MPQWKSRPSDDPLLAGLLANPALPDDLLVRLTREHGPVVTWALAGRRRLPEAALAAMREHADEWVRAALVENRAVDPQVRLGLLDDPHPMVRRRVMTQRDLALPEPDLPRMLEQLDWYVSQGMMTGPEMTGEVYDEVGREPRLLPVLARHPREELRLAACNFSEVLDGPTRAALLSDPSPAVRSALAERLAEAARPMTAADLTGILGMRRGSVLQRRLSPELLGAVLAGGGDDAVSLAYNRHLPPSAIEALVAHPDVEVRRHVAERDDLTDEQAVRLIADPDPEVRVRISVHPVLTEEQRGTVVLDPDVTTGPAGARQLHRRPKPGPGEVRAWAGSVHPLLRLRAAGSCALPADLVAVLAEDPDAGVRTALAVHHPAAPAHLLMPAYLSEKGWARARLRKRPGFPAAGLARFAGDADPGLRLLAVLDPAAGPELLGTLLTDPDEEVRAAAARSPRLPAERIVALLDDPELGPRAAANPALPVAAMERLLSGARPGSAPG